jgi:hypothetical protein
MDHYHQSQTLASYSRLKASSLLRCSFKKKRQFSTTTTLLCTYKSVLETLTHHDCLARTASEGRKTGLNFAKEKSNEVGGGGGISATPCRLENAAEV